MSHFALADAMNRYFEIGCTTFTRHEVLAYGGMDWNRVQNCLRSWESQGLLKILKPLDGASDREIVVKLLHSIPDEQWPKNTKSAGYADKASATYPPLF
jgi:hypothetical protein